MEKCAFKRGRMNKQEALLAISWITKEVEDADLQVILNGVSVLCLVNEEDTLMHYIDKAVTSVLRGE